MVIAVIIDFAQFVVPAGNALQLGSDFAANIVKTLTWANDPAILQSNIITKRVAVLELKQSSEETGIYSNISDDDIVDVNVPNGQPLVYELDADLKPIRSYYLGDHAAIAAALAAVANQGKAK